MKLRTWTPWLLLLLLLAPGCAVKKLNPRPSLEADRAQLEQDLDFLPPLPRPQASSGSLWTDAGPGMAWFRDTRAFQINDLVQIVLTESDTGKNDSTTALDRSSTNDFGASVAFGLEDPTPRPGKFNLNQVLSSNLSSSFSGDGTTARSNLISANISARVIRVLPNGDLIIAGQKTLTINRERQVLTLVGSLRPVDITPSNRASSSAVGELTVRLWGQGEIDATARQGWFMKVLNTVWPF